MRGAQNRSRRSRRLEKIQEVLDRTSGVARSVEESTWYGASVLGYRHEVCRVLPSSCSIPGTTAAKPSQRRELLSSLSQNDGESSLGIGSWYRSCALRKKYMASGFYDGKEQSGLHCRPYCSQGLTIPVFSNLSAATKYHSAARRFAPLSSLRNAACAYKIAVGGSSALKNPIQYVHPRAPQPTK